MKLWSTLVEPARSCRSSIFWVMICTSKSFSNLPKMVWAVHWGWHPAHSSDAAYCKNQVPVPGFCARRPELLHLLLHNPPIKPSLSRKVLSPLSALTPAPVNTTSFFLFMQKNIYSPASSMITSHSFSVTGCTESRPIRTSAMSFSRLSALICSRLTGRRNRFPGLEVHRHPGFIIRGWVLGNFLWILWQYLHNVEPSSLL